MLFYLETVVAQSLKAFCRFCFFSSATKWKDCAIVPSGHWALNTMTTNCDPMKCSHADHTCCLDDELRCHARTGPGHMTNHGIFAYKTLSSVVLCSTCLDYDHPEHHGANAQNTYRRIHKSYCSRPIHTKRCY